jgi:hypothetical protein
MNAIVKTETMQLPVGNSGFRILTPGNPKTEKGRGLGYWTFILHLAPAKLSGYEVCPRRTTGCTNGCLNTAGRGGIATGGILTFDAVMSGERNAIQAARILRTRALFEHRVEFMARLALEVSLAIRKARAAGYTPVFRLNGTSDIRWEIIPCGPHRNIMTMFPDVQFYDYTKIGNRRNIPANYHLTFSLAENNDAAAWAATEAGMNVAVVFRDKATVLRYVASGIYGRAVVRGDDTDLRFLDGTHNIVALYAKGNAKRDASGFVRD